MNITDLIGPADVYLNVELGNKKEVLRFLSDRVSEKCRSQSSECRNALAAREKLGSTAIGAGIAFPHAQLDGLDRALAIFVRPAHPVPYAAADEGPVDLILMLLSPSGATREHLDGLSSFARALRSQGVVQKLREAQTEDDVIAALQDRT
ncbi:PTS sugar transporter subunit IIA [Devosia sp. PTR5]|uniref:PTS sugar transporter subunit IIA n=1 Tax=Devosia oryzisoli TaxID=2774138 RepID=A0A927ISG3_9HYPH|nr:PTS sugar transporter subunit IIA [Devosia oryzisoli]MBD8064802.1 PTS sugar transporter subunit IIA [Devosia oryzisoli]